MVLCALVAAQHEKFQSAPGSRVGTPAYLAPEVIMTTKGQTYDGKVTLTGCPLLAAVLQCWCTGGGGAVCSAAPWVHG